MCIATKGNIMVPLSAQDVCFNSNFDGCDVCRPSSNRRAAPSSCPLSWPSLAESPIRSRWQGGQISTPWSYIKEKGAVTGGQYKGSGPFGSGFCSDFSLPHCHHHGPQGKDPYPAEGAKGCPSESSPQGPKKCDAGATGVHASFKSDKYKYTGKTQSASGVASIQKMIMEARSEQE